MSGFHIVYLCNEYPPFQHGGIGTVTQTLARSMVVLGHRVTVVGLYRELSGELCENDHGVNVIRLGSAHLPMMNFVLNSYRLSARLKQLDKELKIDIIEGQEAAFAFLPRHLPGKKIVRMHGGHLFFSTTLGYKPRFWRTWQEKRSFAKADALCAVSRFVAVTTNRLLRQGGRPTTILPNPVDTKQFSPDPKFSEIKNLLVFVGTLCEKKGIRQLIRAMPAVFASVPSARLHIYGRDTSVRGGGSYRDILLREIPETLASHIDFKGAVAHDHLPAIYASASVCIFPSHMESQGLVILEAMSTGRAVVASRTGPGPELIDHGVDGFLCDPMIPSAIAEAIILLLRETETRGTMGRLAREKAQALFSLQTIIQNNEEFYNTAVGLKDQIVRDMS